MRAVLLILVFVLGLISGMTWVTTPVLFLLAVALFTLLALALVYEPDRYTEEYYAARYRAARERRMREMHLNPKHLEDRYDVFSESKPE